MADKLIGSLFAKARNTARRRYAASASDVGRLMRLFHGTIEALAAAHEGDADAFEAVDEAVGWPKLLRVREEVQELANLAGQDPLVRAADRWKTLRKFAPALIEALEFRAARAGDPMLAALKLLAGLNKSGKREVPADAPMPFRKEWRKLVLEDGQPNRRLYETAVLATLRDKLRSGDVWIERSANYRRFDSYLLPEGAVPEIAAGLKLPATADEWLTGRAGELDRRLKRFSRRLLRGELERVGLRDGRLHVTPGQGDGHAGGARLCRRDRGHDAACPHHRAAARGEPGHRLRVRLHQPAHRRALRRRERLVGCHPGRCHQPWPRPHDGGQPWCHTRQADLDRGRLHPPGHLQGGAGADHQCPPCAARGSHLGRWHHVRLGPAVLPVGQARRRRR